MAVAPEAPLPPALIAVYDLRNGGWNMACRHAMWWGTAHVSAHYLHADRIVVEFRPARDSRWRGWETRQLVHIFLELWASKES